MEMVAIRSIPEDAQDNGEEIYDNLGSHGKKKEATTERGGI